MPRTAVDLPESLIGSGLDLSQPFTTRTAIGHGLSANRLAELCAAHLLVRPLRGCFHAAHLDDTLELRVRCLRLVVPEQCVVTDRTAGWLHGASMILAPGDHLVVPKVAVFHSPGNRLRNDFSASGERRLTTRDVQMIGGLRVTTPLRTACDLGRLLHVDSAMAALDSMLRLGAFDLDELLAETGRFPGYRGVRQLRALVPLADAGSESFGESVLRLRWHQCGVPDSPSTQVEVFGERGELVARLDLAVPAWRYAAEYDGAEFHGSDHEEHDRRRREKLRNLGWIVDVFRREDVFGPKQNAGDRLREGAGRAKLRFHAGSTSLSASSRRLDVT